MDSCEHNNETLVSVQCRETLFSSAVAGLSARTQLQALSCVCVCMHACMHACLHVHICAYVCIYIYIHTHTHTNPEHICRPSRQYFVANHRCCDRNYYLHVRGERKTKKKNILACLVACWAKVSNFLMEVVRSSEVSTKQHCVTSLKIVLLILGSFTRVCLRTQIWLIYEHFLYSTIFFQMIWSSVLRYFDPSVTALARPRRNCTSKVQTHPLVREGARHQEIRNRNFDAGFNYKAERHRWDYSSCYDVTSEKWGQL
jgi:hypothetical protein